MGMETCWRRLVMTVLCGIILFASKADAIKFSAEGVSVPDGVLRVNEATELGCKYIMWRQESLASVTWSIQYSGVKTDFFVYKPANKEVKPGMSMVSVDATNSEEKMVSLRLTDGQEDEVVICCDVKVLRDDGYGSMTTKNKEKCSAPIRVEEQSIWTGRGCGQLFGERPARVDDCQRHKDHKEGATREIGANAFVGAASFWEFSRWSRLPDISTGRPVFRDSAPLLPHTGGNIQWWISPSWQDFRQRI